jgi:pimeloyl-ACP methyl ester carboxylesterase
MKVQWPYPTITYGLSRGIVVCKSPHGSQVARTHRMSTTDVSYETATVDGFHIFYREAGDPQKPHVLLLHGFPTSSHMFRTLIPELASDYHVIAPDLPGFGLSDAPSHDAFAYTFDHLAQLIGDFIEQIGLTQFAMYIFDYGAPVGLRVALRCPERVTAIVTQNGNAYVEGLSKAWEPWQAYWRNPTPQNREACRAALDPKVIRDVEYLHGADAMRVSPDGYMLDIAYLARPGADEAQLDLILDYRSNVDLYPKFQEYFRKYRPPTLAVWGKNDPFFLPPGAEAYRRDNPDAKVVFLDTGHFALETHSSDIAREMKSFLGTKMHSMH